MKPLVLVVVFVIAACVPTLEIEHRPCPCIDGYVCCEGQCISSNQSCGPLYYDGGVDILVIDASFVDVQNTEASHGDNGHDDVVRDDASLWDLARNDTFVADLNRADAGTDAGLRDSAYADGYIGDVSPFERGVAIQPPDLIGESAFGASISLQGDTLVVAAPHLHWGVVYVYVDEGTGFVEQAQLHGDENDPQVFGRQVAYAADTLVIGAPGGLFDAFGGAGRAFVYHRQASIWTRVATLQGQQNDDNARFGTAVAISSDGERVYVGATGESVGDYAAAGAVYEFSRPAELSLAWPQTELFVSSQPVADAYFGSTLAVDENARVLAVTAGSEDPTPSIASNGAVYVFSRSTAEASWSAPQRLVRAASEGNGGEFGQSLALDAGRLLVGTPEYAADQHHLVFTGAAFLYEADKDGVWSQTAILLGEDTPNDDARRDFGVSVAFSSDVAVVGACAYWPTWSTQNEGAAYLFVKVDDTWQQHTRLPVRAPGDDDRFGNAVALNADAVVVGAPGVFKGDQPTAGAVFVYRPLVP